MKAGPDYTLTLGAMAKTLKVIETHPALQMAPETFAHRLREATELAQQQGRRELAHATERVHAAAGDLARLVAGERVGREQNRQLAIMVGVGAVAGVIAWVCLSGPIARTLPASWSVPEKMASATLRLDRWEAGMRLMQSASPQSWARVAEASKLERTNRGALEACAEVAAHKGKRQRCVVMIEPGLAQKQ